MSLPDKFDAATLESLGIQYVPPVNHTLRDALMLTAQGAAGERYAEEKWVAIVDFIFVRLAGRMKVPFTHGRVSRLWSRDRIAQAQKQVKPDLVTVVSNTTKKMFVTEGRNLIAERLWHYLEQLVEPVWHALVPCAGPHLADSIARFKPGATLMDDITLYREEEKGRVLYTLGTTARQPGGGGHHYKNAADVERVSATFQRDIEERLSRQESERTAPDARGTTAPEAARMAERSKKLKDAERPASLSPVSEFDTVEWYNKQGGDQLRTFLYDRRLPISDSGEGHFKPELQNEALFLSRAIRLWFEHMKAQLRRALSPEEVFGSCTCQLECASDYAPDSAYHAQAPCVLKVVVQFDGAGSCAAEIRGFTHDGKSLMRLMRQGIDWPRQPSSPGRFGGEVLLADFSEVARGDQVPRKTLSHNVYGQCDAVTRALVQLLSDAGARHFRRQADQARYDTSRTQYVKDRQLAASQFAQSTTVDYWLEAVKITEAPMRTGKREKNPASVAPDEFDAATLEALGVPYVPPKNLTIEDAIRRRGEGAYLQKAASSILAHIVEMIFVRLHYRAGQKGEAPATRYEADNEAATAGLTRDLETRMSAEARRRLFSNVTDGKGIIEKRLIEYLRKVIEPVWHTLLPCEQSQNGKRVPAATRLDDIGFTTRQGQGRVTFTLTTSALRPYHADVNGYASVQAVEQASEAFKGQLREKLAGQGVQASTSISHRLAAVPEALGNLAEKAVSGARSAADTIQREIERRTGFKPIVGYVGDAPRSESGHPGFVGTAKPKVQTIEELERAVHGGTRLWQSLFIAHRIETPFTSGAASEREAEQNLERWKRAYENPTSGQRLAKQYFMHCADPRRITTRLVVQQPLFDFFTVRGEEPASGDVPTPRFGVYDGMRFTNATFDSLRGDTSREWPKPDEALKDKRLSFSASCADFTGLQMNGVFLSKCILWDAQFERSELKRAYFSLCSLDRASFNDSSLDNSRFTLGFPSTRNKKVHTLTHFERAYLTGAHFEHGTLDNCNFTGATLNSVTFLNVDLIDCDFRGAKGRITGQPKSVRNCVINDGDKVSTFAALQAYLTRDEQPAAKQTAKTAESKTKRKGNPGESSFEQPLWFCVSEDGRRVAVRTEEGEWLIPPPPNERLIVASVVTDGVAIAPFPMLTAYGQLPTVVSNTDDEFDEYRVANPKKPVTFPPIFLNVQPHSLGELTGYDVFAAKNSVTLREQPLGWLPLRAALAYSILSKNTGIQQANRALKNMGHLLAAPAFLQVEDIVPRIKMTGMQNDKAAEMVEADRWAYNLSVHAPRLYDAELLRYLCYVTGLPAGVGLAKASFTLALMGHNLPCLDARLLAVVYGGDQVKAATASMKRLNAKKKAGQLEGARLLDRNDAVDVYLDECRRIFEQFAFMPEDAPFYFSRSQWALWERSPIAKRGRAVEATLHTHEEYAELIDAID